MVDPQRLVEAIRNLLHSGQQPQIDVLQALAADYAEACRDINRRLLRCEEYLRQGLRAEAIQYAQTEPNVLDLLTLLDFAERPHWDQYLVACKIPPPPLFRIETASALNHAYAEAQPLEHLLRNHRRLALARAPIGERLAVLHQLAQVDARNPVWQQDVVAFERVRVQELEREVDALLRASEAPPLERVQALLHEVQGSTWRSSLATGLLSSLQEMNKRVSAVHWQENLSKLAREVNIAHKKDNNEHRVRHLLKEWEQACQQFPLPPSDKRSQAVELAQRWLERLDRKVTDTDQRQQAEAELQQALSERNISDEELEEIYLEVAAFKKGIPAHLDGAYQRRINRIRTASQRSERLVLAVVGLLIAIVVVGGVLFLLSFKK